MSLHKFEPNDIFINHIKTHPKQHFFVYNGKIFYNNETDLSGTYTSTLKHIPTGYISLYEENVDRPSSNLIYPFVTKGSTRTGLKTITTSQFDNDFQYGDVISGSYPLSASIKIEQYLNGTCGGSTDRPEIVALRNTLDWYKKYNPHYSYSSSLGNKSTQFLTLISIPSIFYGSSLKKGSVILTCNMNGSKTGELRDRYKNGVLYETTGSNTNSVAGVVLYNEGFILLTGSWSLDSTQQTYDYCNNTNDDLRWYYWGGSLNGTDIARRTVNTSYELFFEGINYISTITMYCHAKSGELNHSNNPTYIKYNQGKQQVHSSATTYIENRYNEIKNTVKTGYSDVTGSFKKQTWISTIGIYDENKNVIAIAKLARPLLKNEARDLTIKIKEDII